MKVALRTLGAARVLITTACSSSNEDVGSNGERVAFAVTTAVFPRAIAIAGWNDGLGQRRALRHKLHEIDVATAKHQRTRETALAGEDGTVGRQRWSERR